MFLSYHRLGDLSADVTRMEEDLADSVIAQVGQLSGGIGQVNGSVLGSMGAMLGYMDAEDFATISPSVVCCRHLRILFR